LYARGGGAGPGAVLYPRAADHGIALESYSVVDWIAKVRGFHPISPQAAAVDAETNPPNQNAGLGKLYLKRIGFKTRAKW